MVKINSMYGVQQH